MATTEGHLGKNEEPPLKNPPSRRGDILWMINRAAGIRPRKGRDWWREKLRQLGPSQAQQSGTKNNHPDLKGPEAKDVEAQAEVFRYRTRGSAQSRTENTKNEVPQTSAKTRRERGTLTSRAEATRLGGNGARRQRKSSCPCGVASKLKAVWVSWRRAGQATGETGRRGCRQVASGSIYEMFGSAFLPPKAGKCNQKEETPERKNPKRGLRRKRYVTRQG